jgi:cysteinyl-tRNA synthetase
MANGASAEDTPVIEGLLEERDELRRSRDFDGADAIREQLRERFKVVIDDREKMWWVDDGSGARTSRGGDRADRADRAPRPDRGIRDKKAAYQRTGSMVEADTPAIEALLVQRDECRRLRDYDGADTLRDELRFGHNVIVDDNDRAWWVDASAGSGPPIGKQRPYEKGGRGQGAASDEVNGEIEKVLEERDELRRARDFAGADELRDKLREKFNVIVDDRQKTWWVEEGSGGGNWGAERATRKPVLTKDFGPVGHDYVRAEDDEAELGEAEKGDINELLRRRLEAKLGREFEEADSLLEELHALGVQVRTAQWWAVSTDKSWMRCVCNCVPLECRCVRV